MLRVTTYKMIPKTSKPDIAKNKMVMRLDSNDANLSSGKMFKNLRKNFSCRFFTKVMSVEFSELGVDSLDIFKKVSEVLSLFSFCFDHK